MLVLTSGGALGAGFLAQLAHLPPALAIGCFVVSLAAAASVTTRKAVTAIRVGAIDINVLMLIAAAGAVILGEWSEAATVVFLFAVAQALEARTLDRARTAIRALMDLTPAEALVRDVDGERYVDVDQIAPGVLALAAPVAVVPPLALGLPWHTWL